MTGQLCGARTARQELADGSPVNVERAIAWMGGHPGWVINGWSLAPHCVLEGPDGRQEDVKRDLGILMDALERADLRVPTEREQRELLRSEFGRWSITVCDGTWEARPRGLMREDEAVTAPEAWLLAYRLHRREAR